MQGAFEKAGVSLEDMSSSGQRKAAEQLNQFVEKEKPEGEKKITGADGKAAFYNLTEGMYLCAPEENVSYDTGVFLSAPFLVFLPETDELGNCLYDVLVEPKNEWVSTDTETGEKPEQNAGNSSSEGESAKTGDNTSARELIRGLAASTMILALLVFWKMHKERR